MQPGQVIQPGNSSDDNTDGTTPAQDTAPLDSPSNNIGASDIKPAKTVKDSGEVTPVQPEPTPQVDEIPADTPMEPAVEPTATEEQSSDDQTGSDTTPTPIPPAQGGASIAEPQDASEQVAQPEPTPEPAPAPPPPPIETPESTAPPPDTTPTDNDNPAPSPDSNGTQFNWTASEYIEHHHSAIWFGILGLLAIGLITFLLFVFHDILSSVVVLLMAVAIGVYAQRKPESLEHVVSERGIQIGNKSHPYTDFTSFAVLPAKSLINIELDPVKRFMPRISVLIDQAQAESVVDILSQHLPHEDREPELVDRLAHALKF